MFPHLLEDIEKVIDLPSGYLRRLRLIRKRLQNSS